MISDAKKVWIEISGLPKPAQPKQAGNNDPNFSHYREWYVYVPKFGEYGEGYLHSDGKIYSNASTSAKDHSGWFKTKKAALEAIDLYYKQVDF